MTRLWHHQHAQMNWELFATMARKPASTEGTDEQSSLVRSDVAAHQSSEQPASFKNTLLNFSAHDLEF